MRRLCHRINALLLIPGLVLGGSCSTERAAEVEIAVTPRTGGVPPATLPGEVDQLRAAGMAVHSAQLVPGAIPASSGVSPAGIASYRVPIDVAPGPNGMAPSVAIAYSSTAGGGNGPLGVGFDLEGLSSIRRCTPTIEIDGRFGPVQWSPTDPICLDGRRLIWFGGTYGADGSEYRPAQDPSTRVVLHGSLQSPTSWFEVFDRSGTIASYGGAEATLTREVNPTVEVPYGWAIDEQADRFGNTIDYQYEDSPLPGGGGTASLELAAIAYGGTGTESSRRHVLFEYEARPDTPTGYFYGARFGHLRRLAEIIVEGPDAERIFSYDLTYEQHPGTGRSILRWLTKRDRNNQALPATTFEWSTHQGDALEEDFFNEPTTEYIDGVMNADVLLSGDFDGNLQHELLYWSGDGSSPASHNIGGQVAVTTGEILANHDDPLDLIGSSQQFGAHLGPTVIRYDADSTSDLLIPSRPTGSGRDEYGHPFADGFAVYMGYGGGDFNLGWVEGDENGRIYQVVPADHDGDGITDVWLCRGAGYKTAEWILLMDRPPQDASGSVSYEEYPSGIGCSAHDETLVMPLHGGTRETLLVVPAYPTDLATQQQPGGSGYSDGDDRIPESDRDEYLALEFGPTLSAAALVPSSLPRDRYQRWHDRDCLNGPAYVGGEPPVHGAGSGRDRLIDVNGDGLVDLLRFELAVGDDYADMPDILAELWPVYDATDDTFRCHEDIATTATPGRVRVYINTGEEFIAGPVAYDFPGIAHVNFWANWMGGFLNDANADGLPDVFMPGGGHGTGSEWTVLVSNGDGTFSVQTATWNGDGIDEIGDWPGYRDDTTWEEDFAAASQVSIQSVAGAVVPNFVFMGANHPDFPVFEANAPLNDAYAQERVVRVVDGLGLETEFEYWFAFGFDTGTGGSHPAQIYPRLSITRPRSAAFVHRAAGLETTYEYSTGVEDAWGSGSLGWRSRTVSTRAEPAEPGDLGPQRVLVERYDLSREPGVPGYPFAGGPAETDARVEIDVPTGGIGVHIACTTVTDTDIIELAALGGLIVRAYPSVTHSVRAVVPGESLTEPATGCDEILTLHRYHESTSTQTQDVYGTPFLRETTVVGGDTVTEELLDDGGIPGVNNNTSLWLLGQPARSVVESCTAQLDCASRTSDFDWHPVTGALTESVREPGDAELELTTVLGYDTHGNVNSIELVDAAGVTLSSASAHDPEGVNPLWSDDALSHRRYFVHDPATGFRYGVVDPEGLTVYQEVDGFLRPLRSELRSSPMGPHDGNQVFTSYLPGLNGSAIRIRETQTTGQVVTNELDTRGFTIRRTWRGMADATPASLPAIPAGADVYQEWSYDAYGNRRRETLPALDGAAPAGERAWLYDDLGRVTSEEAPDGSTTTWEYFQGADAASFDPGTRTTITDPDLRVLVLEHDTNGHLVRVQESVDAHMCQTWGPFGRVEVVERNCSPFPSGPQNATDYGYDRWNRLTSEHDPAFGTRTFAYDAFGNLRTRVDGNDDVTTYVPDRLGRVIQRTDDDGTARWTYDTQRLGALTSMRTADGVTTSYTYDAFNRVATERQSFRLSGTLTTASPLYRYTYGPGGRVNTVQYPTHAGLPSLTIQHVYDAGGYDRAIRRSGGELYWMAEEADPSGEITVERFGNDAVTMRGFDELTRRPAWIRTTSPPHNVQYLEYEFTPGGDLESRSAPQLSLSEDFEYDYAHRLTNATVSVGVPAVSISTDVTYDALGNIETKTGIGTYQYDPLGRLQGFGTPSQPVVHDDAGRVTQFGTQTLTWSPRDMLRTSSIGASTLSYRYDAAENRVSRQEVGGPDPGWSVTFGGEYEAIYGSTGAIQEVIYRVASATGRIISDRRHGFIAGAWTAASVKYVHDDHLGSGSSQTDATGNPTDAVSYDPWGLAREGDDWNAPYTGDLADMGSGFTGHQAETELRLINMRGRMYSPGVGRFMSADPIVSAPASIQGWNRYSYVGNRPLVFTDPTGWALSWHQVKGTNGDLLMRCDGLSGGACGRGIGGLSRSGFDLQEPLGGGHIGEILAESGPYTVAGGSIRGGIPGTDGVWNRGAQDLRAGGAYAEWLQQMRAHQSEIDRRDDALVLNRNLARPGKPNALQNLAAGLEIVDDATEVVLHYGGMVSPVLGAIEAGIILADDYADDGEVEFSSAIGAILAAKGAAAGKIGAPSSTPSPALLDSPYSPGNVSRRQSARRGEMGLDSIDPDSPIPDQGPGRNIKDGVHASSGKQGHRPGQRNVAGKGMEEHNIKKPGRGGRGPKK